MMNQIEIIEYLNVMRKQEDSIYCCSDYINEQRSTLSTCDGMIDEVCRAKMVQWSYQVIDYIRFRRETVSIAMNYLDRFLSSGCARAQQVMNCRKEYQLAAMTTLFMAIKINEPVMIDMNLLRDLSKGIYKQSDFQQMETDILFGLNWHVNGPTAQSFALQILTILQERMSTSKYDYQRLLELVTFQIELSVGDYKLMTQKPSYVAVASIWDHIENTCPNEKFRDEFLNVTSGIDIQLEDTLEVKETLHALKVRSTLQMRPTCGEMAPPQSPRSTASSLSPKDQPQSLSYTKEGDKQNYSSPICVSRRKMVDSQSQ